MINDYFTEKTRSMAATEKNFTVKMFTFQFFTLFSSLFYVAFFLGRYVSFCVHFKDVFLITAYLKCLLMLCSELMATQETMFELQASGD